MGQMINRRRVMGGGALYDAEVEYLESTGAQYINTGYFANKYTRVLCGFKCAFNNIGICGGRDSQDLSYSLNFDVIAFNSEGSSRSGLIFRFYSSTNNWFNHIFNDEYNEINVGGQYCVVNGQTYNIIDTPEFTLERTFIFFGRRTPSITLKGPLRIYYLQIYDNGNLIFDFVPVRKKSIGYMYDKVSKKLFGNSGTGNFVLGPDV